MTPQEETLLKHLKEHGSISQVEAAAIYKMRSLPRRIKDLKDKGHVIKSELKTDATGQRYARYTLVKEAAKAAPLELKVGAKVRVVAAEMSFGCYKNGDEGTVSSVDLDGDVFVDFPPEDDGLFLYAREVEVIA